MKGPARSLTSFLDEPGASSSSARRSPRTGLRPLSRAASAGALSAISLHLLSAFALSPLSAASSSFAVDAFSPKLARSTVPALIWSSSGRRATVPPPATGSAAVSKSDDESIPYLNEATYCSDDDDDLCDPDGEMSPLRRLVLVGGGHGHVQVIKALNRSARPRNLRVTLIDVQENASYSGMVPGCVSGLYSPEETLIRLGPLAEWAGIEFVRDEVVDVDPEGRKLFLRGDGGGGGGGEGEGDSTSREQQNGGTHVSCVEYDAVSFDIGSASRGLDETPGAREHCIPTRPISDLVRRIDEAGEELKRDIRAGRCRDGAHVVVIGGGAAGIELSMATRARWGPLFDADGDGASCSSTGRKQLRITLLDSGDELLPSETAPCRDALRGVLSRRGVDVRHGSSVAEILPEAIQLEDGTEIPYTHCIWATGAASHPLADAMRKRGVATTDRGWIRVSPSLQSVSHPGIFAAGDCCEIEGLVGNKPSPPKAGVYAVRSGPILIENLTWYLKRSIVEGANGGPKGDNADTDMIRYTPQDDFLKLLMCGDGTALGFRFGIPLEGKWVWDLKDRIDTMFMDLFDAEKLPSLPPSPQDKDIKGGGGEDAAESDEEGKYDTAQYDAAEERWDSLPAREAAELLRRTDDGVDYEEAWHVLRDMMGDDSYRDEVLEAVAVLSSKGATATVPT